ncbi:hypothetical protein ACNKV7_002106 [Vibrio cholerae]|uniref:hypothetical protein n=4 Tax=Vibrio cholerae TaxID=666 RepID=UPI001B82305F|nr:hypothetical protein [Vibrio cholerae]EIR1601386.1 hypothetical protein [Vibrio cholerae]EJL6574516.1 hypothetical protein [Vibrio cholerae]EJL6789195.1 hypothetical protein [Vibrio cholerae]MBS3661374.1 hypothetical protein [Vibrio cholerae]MDD9696690.1 hypothetical protein [Vibrio cholerae]
MKKLIFIVLLSLSGTALSESGVKPLPEKLEKEISKNMSESSYFPMLKPGDWVGITHGVVHQTLIGEPEKPDLVIGFGMDTPENFIFLMHSDEDKLDIQNVVNNAYSNLESMDVVFTLSQVLDNKVLTASGKPFSSEAILSKKHMLKAHEILNAKQMLVSIPRRTGLMAVSRDAPKEILNQFMYLHSHAWNDASYGNAPIANVLFLLEGGEIVAIIPMD